MKTFRNREEAEKAGFDSFALTVYPPTGYRFVGPVLPDADRPVETCRILTPLEAQALDALESVTQASDLCPVCDEMERHTGGCKLSLALKALRGEP